MKKRRWAKTAAFFEYLWNIYLPYAILVTLEGKPIRRFTRFGDLHDAAKFT